MKVLLYGYGNPGRQDDGLGVAFVNMMEAWARENNRGDFDFENNYQLNIEDAEAVSNYDLVIFADASQEDIEDFCISKVDESSRISFTTHEASPGYVVKLGRELFGNVPPTFLLHIKGYEWEFREGISGKARQNLEKAFDYCKGLLNRPEVFLKEHEKIKHC